MLSCPCICVSGLPTEWEMSHTISCTAANASVKHRAGGAAAAAARWYLPVLVTRDEEARVRRDPAAERALHCPGTRDEFGRAARAERGRSGSGRWLMMPCGT
jgi:hypothetical protein